MYDVVHDSRNVGGITGLDQDAGVVGLVNRIVVNVYCPPEGCDPRERALHVNTAVMSDSTGDVHADVVADIQRRAAAGVIPPFEYCDAVVVGCFNIVAVDQRARFNGYPLPVVAAKAVETGPDD